jgi:hypothetical protein
MRIKSPSELQSDERFRAEVRDALANPAIQTALSSLRFHKGLFRTSQAAAPANIVHHSAVWSGGFNAALDMLEELSTAPTKRTPSQEPWEFVKPDPENT